MFRPILSRQLCIATLTSILMAAPALLFAQGYSRSAYPTGYRPYGLDAANYTGDGALDLVVAHYGAGTAMILQGDGAGGFGACTGFAAGPARDVSALNFNDLEDHFRDAFVAIDIDTGGRSLGITYGAGDCTFFKADFSGMGKDARSVLSADFDLDGHVDLVISQISLYTPEVPVCQFIYGDGTSGSVLQYEEIQVGDDPERMTMADFDLDGDLDVGVACRGSHEVWILLNQGGSFLASHIITFDSSVGLFALAAGDFNTDGWPDLAIPDTDGGRLYIAIGDGTGAFDAGVCSPIAIPLAGRSIVAALLDHEDSHIDLAIAHDAIDQLTILEGDGTCGFAIAEEITTGLQEPKTVVAADFNADACTDLAVTNYGGDNVAVFINECCNCDTDASWSNYGAGWPGTNGIPCLLSSGDPEICSTICLTICNSLGFPTLSFLFLGLAPADLPTPWEGRLLLRPYRIFQAILPAGGLVLCGDVPCDATLCGLHVYLQVLELDPGASRGVSFSQGLDLLLGC
ncbi:MAG: VCBS repeat-containing protein [Planctomycetota bacterium]